MARQKRYAHLNGDTAYLPYAARSTLRKKQRRRAVLLGGCGAFFVLLATAALLREGLGNGGQPAPPVAVPAPSASAAPTEPPNVLVRPATVDTQRDVLAAAGDVIPQTLGTPTPADPTLPTGDILPQYRELYTQNPDLVGWLRIDGTQIDYPVVQVPGDNAYYLRRGFDRLFAARGTLFVDGRCCLGLQAGQDPTANWLVYGHNMASGAMFGTLDAYAEEDFYRKHPTFTFDTLYTEGQWQVAAVLRTTLGAEELPYYAFFDAATRDEWDAWMQAILPLALYDTGVVPQYGEQLLTLSTCGDLTPGTDTRLAVLAVRVPPQAD